MNILLINTEAAKKYPEMFKTYLEKHNVSCFMSRWDENEVLKTIKENNLLPTNTIIHARTAGPHVTQIFKNLEQLGYIVINNTKTLGLTSNKYDSQIYARERSLPTAETFKVAKQDLVKIKDLARSYKAVICKPIYSEGRGVYCKKIDTSFSDQEIINVVADIPGDEIIVQEFIQYRRLVRAIVIGYELLENTLTYDMDTPEYRASVCMNPNIKKFTEKRSDLKILAEKTAKVFEAEISFIDFFIDQQDKVILNELNTACGLIIHERVTGIKIHQLISDYLIQRCRQLLVDKAV